MSARPRVDQDLGKPPPDAQRFFRWTDDEDDNGTWVRNFDGTKREVDDAQVFVDGSQYQDGRARRSISIEARGSYDPTTARRIAEAIIGAADEIEALQ